MTTLRNAALTALLIPALGALAPAAELKLLSQGLPAGSYTGGNDKGEAKSGEKSSPEKAFDGIWDGPGATAFNLGPAFPAWVMVDLGAEAKVIKTMTYTEKPNVWFGYKIEVSSDRQAWTAFADQTANKEPSEEPAYTDMGGVTGRYVRVTLTDAPDRDKQWFWPVIMEFRVYGVPVEKSAKTEKK